MKRFIALGLSVLTLTFSVATSVKAAGQGDHPFIVAMNSNASKGITPFELTSRAYQGAYTAQGIAGFGSLSNGRIAAQDLVRAAIDAQELSPEVITNSNYLNAVELQLNTGKQ